MLALIQRMRNQIRKADAAAALENLLKIQVAAGNLSINSHLTASSMISQTWEQSRKYMKWHEAHPLHKVALVAAALAERLEKLQVDDEGFIGYGIALGTVLSTAKRNNDTLEFSASDDLLLEMALETQVKACAELNKQTDGSRIVHL